VQTHLVALREYLRRRGHACGVVNLTRHRQTSGDEVWFPHSAAELAWLLARLPYAILHLHFGGMLTRRLLALGLLCAWLPGRRAVLTFHSGGYPSSPEGRATRRGSLRAWVMRQFVEVIAVNAEIGAWFAQCGVPAERIHVIAPHVVASPGAELRDDLRAFYGTHSPVVLSVGLLEPEYDLPLQIEVLGRVRERLPKAGLVLIGSGSLEAELRGRIAALPWAEHVLLAGDVAHPATLRAIAECVVYVRTTLYDGDSISVREALHLGVPVVVSDNGMRPAGCRLIPRGDARALAEAIVTAADAPRTPAEERGEENLEAVLRLYQGMDG
jgi:glycosyltransferase involved in cell wall biosynthesis